MAITANNTKLYFQLLERLTPPLKIVTLTAKGHYRRKAPFLADFHPMFYSMYNFHKVYFCKSSGCRPTVFDLYLLPINLVASQEQTSLPGFLALEPPRRAERARAADLLLVYLTLTGNETFLPTSFDETLHRLASSYFVTRGSVTSGLRATAEQLNKLLLDRNLRNSREGWQISGRLSLAALHGSALYLAQVGPTSAFLVKPDGLSVFGESRESGHGLGVSRTIDLRFFQARVEAGDFLVVCAAPPSTWTAEALTGSGKLSFDQLRRRLLNQAEPGLKAGMVQFRHGSGALHFLAPRALAEAPADAEASEAAGLPHRPEPAEQSASPAGLSWDAPLSSEAFESSPAQLEDLISAAPLEAAGGDEPQQADSPASALPESLAARRGAPVIEDEPALQDAQPARRSVARRPRRQADPAAPPALGEVLQTWKKRLAELWLGGRSAYQRVEGGSKTFIDRMLPESELARSGPSPATLLFIAIAVPLILAAVAATVYVRHGRGEQHRLYLGQAQQFVEQAVGQQDAALRRNAWTQVVYWLDKAEEYGRSEESQALLAQARQELDSMEGIARLDLLSAVPGGFAGSVQIERIAASNTDVYLLDASQGRVLRLFLTGQGYAVDTQFNCGPGPSGAIIINPLIDLAILPPNNPNKATVLAIDKTGNLLYCIPGSPPLSTTLTPPDSGWGKISGISINQETLYVLDVANNAVWYYPGEGMSFSSEPRLYFDKEIPTLTGGIGLAVNGDDLYVLHDDGRMTFCTFRVVSFGQTKCTDSATYGDLRPGRPKEVLAFEDASFTQMVATSPPDPSLYILDTRQTAIYHFSLRLNLQRRLQPMPDTDPPLAKQTPTAFGITPNRVVFLAFKNQVYYGPIP